MKDLDPSHTLSLLTIKTGDLFLTRENNHGRPPVIGFFEYTDGVTKITTLHHGQTSYFMPIKAGTVGIYFRKNVNRLHSNYWSRFHEVWINGKRCVIHEQFIDPLPKGANNG
mgnify:FL=1